MLLNRTRKRRSPNCEMKFFVRSRFSWNRPSPSRTTDSGNGGTGAVLPAATSSARARALAACARGARTSGAAIVVAATPAADIPRKSRMVTAFMPYLQSPCARETRRRRLLAGNPVDTQIVSANNNVVNTFSPN